MFGLGIWELVIILVIVLIIFGAGKLPQIGEGLGKAISGFKRSLPGDDDEAEPGKKEKDTEREDQCKP